MPSRRHLSRIETLKAEPALEDTPGLVGSFLFYDCQAQNMERLCLENALSAYEKGACILNHTEATDFIIAEGAVRGIHLRDKLTGEDYIARGRIALNATGPWASLVWNKLNVRQKFNLRRTKGVHLLTRKIANHALVLFARRDGRLFFVIPWNNNSLIGTTDTDYSGEPESVSAGKSDIEYLVAETRNYFPQFKPEDIFYTMAGLRPLVAGREKAESNISRVHKLIDHEHRDKLKSFISVLGGKITAYRAIAEEAVDLVCRKLNTSAYCSTAQIPLPGAPALNRQEMEKISREKLMPVDVISHLAGIYGSRLSQVLEFINKDKELGDPIISGYPDIRAQIKHAILEEEAVTVSDFMLRRSTLGLAPAQGREVVETVAREMGLREGWTNIEAQRQIFEYQTLIDLTQSFRTQTV